jgi:hypothetical protein
MNGSDELPGRNGRVLAAKTRKRCPDCKSFAHDPPCRRKVGFRSLPLMVRVWRLVEIGQPDECWLWQGTKKKAGYGTISEYAGVVDGRDKRTSHLVTRMIMQAPEGMVIRHTCDNPPCCNPRHLLLGSQQENIADMIERGRKNAFAKLTDDDVRAIRNDSRPNTVIAAAYGISPMYAGAVKRRMERIAVPDH